jgi:hypothetical protein
VPESSDVADPKNVVDGRRRRTVKLTDNRNLGYIAGQLHFNSRSSPTSNTPLYIPYGDINMHPATG